jgi:hypothetical protein
MPAALAYGVYISKRTGATNEQELFTNPSIWVHPDFNSVLCTQSLDIYVVFFWTYYLWL